VYDQKVPFEEEDEAPPPGSKLAQRRSQGPAERQREEGLRAFNLLVAGVKPPDLGGTTFTVGPVLVLVVVQLVVGLVFLVSWSYANRRISLMSNGTALLKVHNLVISWFQR